MANALDRIAHAVEHIATIQGHRFNMEFKPLSPDLPTNGGGDGGYATYESQHHPDPRSAGGGPSPAVETAAAPNFNRSGTAGS